MNYYLHIYVDKVSITSKLLSTNLSLRKFNIYIIIHEFISVRKFSNTYPLINKNNTINSNNNNNNINKKNNIVLIIILLILLSININNFY